VEAAATSPRSLIPPVDHHEIVGKATARLVRIGVVPQIAQVREQLVAVFSNSTVETVEVMVPPVITGVQQSQTVAAGRAGSQITLGEVRKDASGRRNGGISCDFASGCR